MDTPTISSVPPRLSFPNRSPSPSPRRSPTRQRITDDILSDLSPTTTLEAFTSPSGKLRASIEAATPSERAFGIRATTASKKIQEWVDELSAWPWPTGPGPQGFELPSSKRRKLSFTVGERRPRSGYPEKEEPDEVNPAEYMGSLPTHDVLAYEVRVEEIREDMDDLDVEEIKRTVLNKYFSPNSRPSSSASNAAPPPSFSSGYTKMDDFTAVVAATILRALPTLSRLMRLMDVWSTRLSVLRKIPPLLEMLHDAEVALQSGWQAIRFSEINHNSQTHEKEYLDRATFEIMRNVLHGKVMALGQDIDRMLDALEGREDTLPEAWLDRMETIETDYSNWVVSGDRRVREGEWAKLVENKKKEVERLRLEEQAKNAARLEEERLKQQYEEKLKQGIEDARIKAEEAARVDQEQIAELARLEQEQAQKIVDEEIRVQKKEEAEATEFARKQALQDVEAADSQDIFDSRGLVATKSTSLDSPTTSERFSRIIVFDGSSQSTPKIQDEAHPHNLQDFYTITGKEANIAASETNPIDCPSEECRESEERTGSIIHEADCPMAERHTRPSVTTPDFSSSESAIEEVEIMVEGSGPTLSLRSKGISGRPQSSNSTASLTSSSTIKHQPYAEFEFDGSNDTGAAGDLGLEDTNKRSPQSPVEQVRTKPQSISTDDVFPSRARSPSSPTRTNSNLFDDYQMRRRSTLPSISSPLRPGSSKSQAEFPSSRSHSVVSDKSKEDEPSYIPASQQATSGNNDTRKDVPQVDGKRVVIRSPVSSERKSEDSEFGNSAMAVRHSRNTSLIPAYLISLPTPGIQVAESAEYFHPSELAQSIETDDPAVLSLSPTMAIEVMPTLISSTSTDQSDSEPPSAVGSVDGANESRLLPQGHELGELNECHSPLVPQDPSLLLEQIKFDRVTRLDSSSSDNSVVEQSIQGRELSNQLAEELPHTPSSDGEAQSPSRRVGLDAFPYLNESPTPSSLSKPVILPKCRGYECACTCPRCTIQHRERLSLQTVKSPLDNPWSDITGENGTGKENDWSSASHSSADIRISPDYAPTSTIMTPTPSEHISSEAGPSTLTASISFPVEVPVSPTRSSVALSTSDSWETEIANTKDEQPVYHRDDNRPSTPLHDAAPDLPDLKLAATVPLSPRKLPTTDYQIHTQISTLLESMPTAIRLASEPPLDMTPVSRFSSSQKETLQVNKTRRSLPNTARSQSSLSIRSATPAFTLRPAYNKANPAPRHSSSHPEIRVYHLSRHGDAPIKLHIRRVGESGERLMVRTGGGWADLGEYLTAYIHHHGRRIASGQGEDKVEVQNLGAGMGNRTASSSSTNFRASKGTTSNGRESPGPRSNSVLSMDRPMSSLFVRKTRRSVGETESRISMVQIRNPSTPVPARQETPEAGDSAKTAPRLGNRSVSRQEWTEEDRGLGLAGPGSKRKDISETEQEWVRSTTEKVKQASAEKEKGKEKTIEKSGTTRRLFRKE